LSSLEERRSLFFLNCLNWDSLTSEYRYWTSPSFLSKFVPGREIASSWFSSPDWTDSFSCWIDFTRAILSPFWSMRGSPGISFPAVTLTPKIAGLRFRKTYLWRISSLQIVARAIKRFLSISAALFFLHS